MSERSAATTPSAADFIAYAKLMNGTCPTCGTIKAHDHTPRCKCLADLSPLGGGPNPEAGRAR